jgi:nucleotidyltransferase/DNA polymerase involved in DNA repair
MAPTEQPPDPSALDGAGGGAPCYLYVDCDRFYFAVEAAERPGLADDPRPVIIGRDPREAPRGIVTTANDAARALGIHSVLKFNRDRDIPRARERGGYVVFPAVAVVSQR